MFRTSWSPIFGVRSLSVRLMFLLLFFLISTTMASAHPLRSHAEPLILSDMDNDVSQWSIFQDGGLDSYTLTPVDNPSLDGQALSLALLGGTPYTGIHAYRSFPQMNATTFDLQLSFYLSKQENLQGLEFTMDHWHAGKRMEWAMQWEQFGDGTIQQGLPPTWRIWTGQNWQNIGIMQPLALNSWHTFSLLGDTFHGQVRYLHFRCDDLAAPISLTFPPIHSGGEKVVVGAQLDGNAQEEPTTVTLDQVSLSVV